MKILDKLLNNNNSEDKAKDSKIDKYKDLKIYKSVDKNVSFIKDELGESFDLVVSKFLIESGDKSIKIALLYMNAIIEQGLINETYIDVIRKNFDTFYNKNNKIPNINDFKNHILTITETSDGDDYKLLFNFLLSGDTIFLIEGFEKFIILNSRSYRERAVESPQTHISIKGPKDSFNENLLTNVTMVRRRIKSPNLWIKKYVIGSETNTDIAMMYLKGTCDEALVNEVHKRLKAAEAEYLLDSSYLMYYIKDSQFSVFPTATYDTERPDVTVANLLEGKVCILVDGSPYALICPTVFIQLIQSVEDYYQKAFIASFYRVLRMLGFYISMLLPAFYIALTSMHSEMIPFSLYVQISAQRDGLPFPTFFEALLMGITYDLLREASVRMPTSLGSAISIVGALVLGEAAVQAGIVSPIMVVVVSITAISTLVIPNYNLQLSVSILRYLFIIAAVGFGFYGIALGILGLFLHLCSLRSFGVSYYVPFAPFKFHGQRDGLFRAPLDKIFKRKKNFTDKFPK